MAKAFGRRALRSSQRFIGGIIRTDSMPTTSFSAGNRLEADRETQNTALHIAVTRLNTLECLKVEQTRRWSMDIDLKKFKTIEDLPDDPEKLKAIMLSAFTKVERLSQDVAVLERLQVKKNKKSTKDNESQNRFSTNKKLFIDIDQQTG